MLTKRQTEQRTSKFLPEENDLKNVPHLVSTLLKWNGNFINILKPSHQAQKNDVHDQKDRTV